VLKPVRAAILCIWLLQSIFLAPACLGAQAAYVLLQTSQVSGKQKVFVTQDALKIVCLEKGVTIYANGPQWTVRLFNEQNKQYWDIPEKKWKGLVLGTADFALGPYSSLSAKKTSTAMYRGRKVQCVQMLPHPSDTSEPTKRDISNALYFVDPEISSNQHISHIMQILYKLPLNNNLPLEFRYFTEGHNGHQDLITMDIKREQIDPSSLSVPKHAKKAKNESDVVFAGLTGDVIRDFIGPDSR